MGLMIVFWIAVVIAIVYLVRHLASRPSGVNAYQGPQAYGQAPGPQNGMQGRSDAIRILEERYARGEMEQEEFLKRKADLTA